MENDRYGTSAHARVWLITGASSGFGHELSRAVLANGDRLVATARDRSAIEPLEHEHTGRARALALDVTDAAAASAAIEQAVSAFGRLDVVVNNAGSGYFGAIEELTEEDLRRQFEVNVFGTLNVTRAALPRLRAQRSGQLVQISSLNGVIGLIGGGAYAGSKFAVEGISESLAQEVAHLGITVTIVEPGPHRTGFAGHRARMAEPIDDYADSVGIAREAFAQMDGNQPGDPALAAQAIIRAVEADTPPLRLPLGETAVTSIRGKLDEQRRELDEWLDLSLSTDAPA